MSVASGTRAIILSFNSPAALFVKVIAKICQGFAGFTKSFFFISSGTSVLL